MAASRSSSKTPATLLEYSRTTAPTITLVHAARALSPTRRQPFRFFDLPPELRLKIYEEALCVSEPLDLDPKNQNLILPRLSLFLVSRRMHEEAYRVFYGQPLRLFPLHGRFFNTKKPLIARLPTHYRNVINSVELRLGPGFSAPPRCQKTLDNPALGLEDCTNLRTLKIFVQCDPSDSFFSGFRGKNATEETYKFFCLDLIRGIFASVPSLETVEIDAYSGVKRDAPLIMALERKIKQERGGKLALVWGPSRGWDREGDGVQKIGLEKEMAGMRLGDGAGGMGRVIEVKA